MPATNVYPTVPKLIGGGRNKEYRTRNIEYRMMNDARMEDFWGNGGDTVGSWPGWCDN